jgi:hypothetical protein
MLRYFLRKPGMRYLGLPAAVPVAVLPVVSGHADRSCSATSVTARTTSGSCGSKSDGQAD